MDCLTEQRLRRADPNFCSILFRKPRAAWCEHCSLRPEAWGGKTPDAALSLQKIGGVGE